jgi:hypothetical protein
MFVGKASSLHCVEPLKGALLGFAPGLPANIRLGWKGLPGTNILVSYEDSELMAVKKFY